MIRKKVLCSSVILSAMLLSKLYSNPQTESIEDPYKQKLIAYAVSKVKEKESSPEKQLEAYYKTITFADECPPMEDSFVKRKLGKYLSNFSFKKQQSHYLHEKAAQHLPSVSTILMSYGIPEDFKYIPLVESGMDAGVRSHKGAGGYWQFMPQTARLFGLKVNSKVDERLDLVKSTHAAARYLQYLYSEFGDWTLVAAAYNVGGGSLKSSLRRQGVDNYYALRLNSETAAYVYKLISVKEVIENPEKYGYDENLHISKG
ncbi:lytic transglycosylase domain-containing protein [Sphingobacterium olei]|uniref:Lytic transglycosylase domain-containing protein n=1 Tax=Sphingobacterium olei TaxID=2571155 RepID=A0A4U0NA68_9SPHI|nr:lytic transglycosylase domain-containing protein [Sphingobacterium olei]TJZ50779.1 lytic transglycosylase domain-containing protein [Sphingobacterium olei]